jgi:hypothetical protein
MTGADAPAETAPWETIAQRHRLRRPRSCWPGLVHPDRGGYLGADTGVHGGAVRRGADGGIGGSRCDRAVGTPRSYRNGTRARQLLGSFGPVRVSVPRARMPDAEGGMREWRSSALPFYARMTGKWRR